MEPEELIILFEEGAKQMQAYCREVAQELGLHTLHTAWPSSREHR